MYIATEITVNNITYVSESGTINIANEIQNWEMKEYIELSL